MRRRTHPTAIQADRDTRSCHVPRRSRWGTVRWRGFECFVPSPPPRAPAISRTSDAPLLLDRRGWLLWAGSRGRVSCWPAIVATTAFFLSHCPHHQTQSHFSRRGGRATSSLRSTNKSPVTSSHFPTTSCQNLWLSPRFPSILVHQELGASWWLRRADGAATRGPLPCPVGCLRNLTPPPPPPAWRCTGRDAPLLAGIRRLAHPSEPLPAAAKLHRRGNHRSPEPDRTGWSCWLAENGLVVRLPVRRVACSLVSERVPVSRPGITDGRVEARGTVMAS